MAPKKTLALILLISIIFSGSIYLSAVSTLSAFNAEDMTTREAITVTAELGVTAIPDLLELLETGSFGQRWSALMSLNWIAYQNTGARQGILADLEPYLEDTDDTIRMKTAEIMAFYGEKNGLPVLIEFLGNEEAVPLSEPPHQFSARALHVLQFLTEETLETKAEWQNWWNINENSLDWNEESRAFEVV